MIRYYNTTMYWAYLQQSIKLYILFQSNEVGSSVAMEKEGFVRCIMFLYAVGIAVSTLVTDKHTGIRKWVADNMTIDHRFDVWHIAKSKLI